MTENRRLRTAIVEDHPLFREAISDVVDSMPQLELGVVSSDPDEAIAAFAEQPPDLVLVDYSLATTDALAFIVAVAERWPSTRCLVLSGHVETELVDQALAAGAAGYVVKGRPREFEAAIDAMMAGETYVSEALSDGS